MSPPAAPAVLRERLKAFLVSVRPKLISEGADLDRLSQLRRMSDVRIRRFAVGRPRVTGLDLCELLSEGQSGRFDRLAEETGLLHPAHLGPALAPLSEEMGYVVEACLVLQVLGAPAVKRLALHFVGMTGKAPSPSAAEAATVPSARPAMRPLPESVNRVLGRASELWTPPPAALKILDLLRTADTPADLVCREIERDPQLASGCVRLANAVRYSPGAKIESVKRVLASLGYPMMHRIVAAAALLARVARPRAEADFNLAAYWMHSLGTAHAAALVCRLTRLGHPDEHFFAGLLHDVGKLAADRYLAPADQGKAAAIHAEIGACACEIWRMPAAVAEAARHHAATPEVLEEIQLPREALVVAAMCRVMRDADRVGDGSGLLNLPPAEIAAIRMQAEEAAKGCVELFK